HELKMVPVSENKSDAPLVPVSEKKGDDPFDFDLLGENDSAENVSNSFAPRVAENSAANSPETVEVKKLKALLGVLDNLYSLNSAQDIHQKLESAESLFDVLKANEDRKPMPHSKAVMFMGPAGPENKVQVEAGSELNPDDLTQQKPGAPPRSTPT
ncbi:MAG TPA: hypothetical protein VGU44_04835, partial [Gammaproteobacteria bacterium]|nr:hypothetical protein [Gammaproteobacteria bacterium]